MKTTLLIIIILLVSVCTHAQEVLTAKCIGEKFTKTKNKSYWNREMLFLKDNNEKVKLNLKLPYDKLLNAVFDPGLYKRCILNVGNTYTISLKKICVDAIPDEYESYYKYNAVAKGEDCSKFKEVKKNTDYVFTAKYGSYVDIDNVVYEVIELTTDNDCF